MSAKESLLHLDHQIITYFLLFYLLINMINWICYDYRIDLIFYIDKIHKISVKINKFRSLNQNSNNSIHWGNCLRHNFSLFYMEANSVESYQVKKIKNQNKKIKWQRGKESIARGGATLIRPLSPSPRLLEIYMYIYIYIILAFIFTNTLVK